MSKRTSCGSALAIACAPLACFAIESVAPPATVEYRPAQRSALVAARDSNFVVAKWQAGMQSTTMLARQQGGATPRPVARLVQMRRDSQVHVSVQRLAQTDRADDETATLAQLYSLVLRQEPQGRYCLGEGGRPCDAARDGLSHAQVLQALAGLRERVVASAPAAVPWRVVEMHAVPTASSDEDVVGVRVTSREGPLQDVAVYFNRAPHSICTARTRADGVATCRLEDQHGDEHQHDHAMAVVATFPGDVRADRVILPTTHVLPTNGRTRPPAFARPLVLPSGKP